MRGGSLLEYSSTQAKILEIGKKEFLVKGFKDASLRGIVKEAGFTQGAFYGYYKDKEALFHAIVAPVCDLFLAEFGQAQQAHFDLIPQNETKSTMELSKHYLNYFVNFMYDHYDVFKLVICCSEGTKYETFTHDIVELDVKRTSEYFDALKKRGKLEGTISPELQHIVTSAYFAAFFEMIIHDIPRGKALHLAQEISTFFESGWNGILRYL